MERVPMAGYTQRAETVFQLAKDTARGLGHIEVCPSHILIGLLRDGSGVAANVLWNRRFTTEIIVAKMSEWKYPTSQTLPANLPWSNFAQYVTKKSVYEAQRLGHEYVGTEHLLLSLTSLSKQQWLDLVSENELEEIKQDVLELLGHGEKKPEKKLTHEEILVKIFAIRDAVEELAKSLQ